MCGIAGIIDIRSDRKIDQSIIIKMRDRLTHRGPDEAGLYIKPGIALAHRRLSIIDISSGHQPLSNEDDTVTIIFNGEIYNYQELTITLKNKGYTFNTNSDTETILHAWEEWGTNCVHHLRGMFAFAIWDAKCETLFLARDRLGVKPLLYSVTDDGYFIFASEHKALLEYPGLSRNINLKSVETYFALGYITDPDSIYESISKLPAAHSITIKKRNLKEPEAYWDLPFSPNDLTEDEARRQLLENFKQAVQIRMVAEVPLGAFLSGGVDSSSVVAMMSQLQSDPVNTCSIGFNDPKYNESNFAQQVADRYQTNHFLKTVESDDYDLIDTLIDIYDEPYADSSALPTYRVCELAKTRVTVALSGDGADELMSGYRHHKMHLREEKLRTLIPLFIRKAIFGFLAAVYPKADWAPRIFRAKSTFQALASDSISAYFNTVSQINDNTRELLFSNEFKKQLNGFNAKDVFYKYANLAPSKDPQAIIQYIDAKTYLVSDILTKVDRASMAHSLEVRNPLLDHKWVEWITGISSKYKFDGKTGKSLFKRTMEPYLPKDILYRNKMGFSVPLSNWFRGPLKDRVHDTLTGQRLRETGWFNSDFLARVEREHQSGIRDHSTLIWSLVMFEAFLKKEQLHIQNT